MNYQREWRIKYAKYIFNSIELLTQELETVFIGGSVGGKYVDEYADLELCFIWKKEINQEVLDDFYQRENMKLRGKQVIRDSIQGIEYSLWKKSFQIDFYHYNTKEFNKIKELYYQEEKMNLASQELFYVLLNCKVLKGADYLRSFQELIGNYPINLSKFFVKKYIKKFLKADVNLFMQRKDWVIFYSLVSGYQKLIFLVLLALNRMYFPAYKNAHFFIEKLRLKPASATLLYENIYQLSPPEIWELLLQAQLDVLHLVKQVYPEIDIAQNLTYLEFQRKANIGMEDLIE